MNRPDRDEYAPYYEKYISLIEPDTLIPRLEGQMSDLRKTFDGLSEDRGLHRYEPGKWTLKESLCHVVDTERMFAYRALRISRGDTTPIEGFEQDNYIEYSNANNRTFADLLDEFEFSRKSNLRLINNLDAAASERRGTASGNTVSVRALVYMMAGHIEHHLPIFRDKYLA